jgi:hypothetical protein
LVTTGLTEARTIEDDCAKAMQVIAARTLLALLAFC